MYCRVLARSVCTNRIPTTGGQQKSLPWIKHSQLDCPATKWQVVVRMALEIFTFRSLFRNTDMARQKELLTITLSYMMLAHSSPQLLDRVAVKHNHMNLDIKPHLYDFWLESMIAAVHQTDPKFTREVAKAWRDTLKPGIDYLVSRYKG